MALPKGRLGDKVYNLLAGVGYGCPENYNDTRKLVVENPEAGIRYFLVKPSDVAIYVEHGAADIGIVGKDILTESGADVYELLDTGLGKCRMCVAGPKDFNDDPGRTLRVATKSGTVRRHCRHCGNRHNAEREQSGGADGVYAHLRPIHCQPCQLPVQAPGN